MEYKYANKEEKTTKVIIEPIFDEYYLEKKEVLVIKTDDDIPIEIDIDESDLDLVVLTLDSHFFYKTEIIKVIQD